MDTREIIAKLRDEVKIFMTNSECNILPNVVIALAVSKLEDIENPDDQKVLIDNNNFFCLKANKKYSDPIVIGKNNYRRFDNIQSAIKMFCNSIDNISGIVSTELAVNSLTIPEKIKKRLFEIIKQYGLIDNEETVETIIEQNSIEVKGNEPTEAIVNNTTNKPEEKKDAPRSYAKEVDKFIKTEEAVPAHNPNKIQVTKAPLYSSPTATVPSRVADGYYFLCNRKMINNRYPIVAKPKFIGNSAMIIGWFNKKDIAML